MFDLGTIIPFLLTGAFVGFLSGLFGIGGGIIMVPALIACFSLMGGFAGNEVTMAVATSLACMLVISGMTAREHYKAGNLASLTSRGSLILLGCLLVGAGIGSSITISMKSQTLIVLLSTFQMAMGVSMWRPKEKAAAIVPDVSAATALAAPAATFHGMTPDDTRVEMAALDPLPGAAVEVASEPSTPVEAPQLNLSDMNDASSRFVLFMTGLVCSLVGIGGAVVLTPYFLRRGIDMRRCSALSTYFAPFVGLVGFIHLGLLYQGPSLGKGQLGLINVPAWIAVVLGSLFVVKLGVKLSAKMSPVWLARGFSVFLFLSAFKGLSTIKLA